MLWLAGTQLPAQTRGARREESYSLQAMQETARQGEEDRRGRRRGEEGWAMGKPCSGSDVQEMTFRTSTVEHRFRRCAKLLD